MRLSRGNFRQFGRAHWERDKTSQFVVVDLKSQPTEQVNALRKGQGKLLPIQSNAQPVIIVVRENSAPAIEASDDNEED